MEFLERNLEDIIFSTDNDLLNGRGLNINGLKKRQVKIGNYGIADIITLERKYYSFCKNTNPTTLPYLEITVFELKRNVLDVNSLLQALRYVKGIKSYLLKKEFPFDVYFNISLVGSRIDSNNDFVYLTDMLISPDVRSRTINSEILSSFELFKYSIGFNGINFENEYNYKLREEGF